jgi:hypothetical protein
VLAYRDEIISLLKTLDREEHIAARGFYLTAWSGKDRYTFDRIIRGQTHIKAACVSMLGSVQPGKLTGYLRAAMSGDAGDDGLIQRFGLLAWPDQSPEWREADRYALAEPKAIAWKTFERLNNLTAELAGAQFDEEYEKLPFLRFDEPAREIFAEWRGDLERRLRSGDMMTGLESHLAKYRKLVPTLALINHLADGGAGPSLRGLSRNPRQSRVFRRRRPRGCRRASDPETYPARRSKRRIYRSRHPQGMLGESGRSAPGPGRPRSSCRALLASRTAPADRRSPNRRISNQPQARTPAMNYLAKLKDKIGKGQDGTDPFGGFGGTPP